MFEVMVEPGMKDGQKITFRGEAGYSDPSISPGDVIFVVEAKEHPVFKRVNIDLVIEKKITLVEALCGSQVSCKHLDGRIVKFGPPEGCTIQPDSWHRVDEEGMPVHGQPMVKGNLYVHYEVEFPQRLVEEQRIAVVNAFGPPPEPSEMEDEDLEEEHVTKKVSDFQTEIRSRAKFGKEYRAGYSSSDSDDERGGQRVRCAQQ